MKFINILYHLQYNLLKNNKNCIIAENCIDEHLFIFRKCNWGDELNKFFLEYVTGKRVVNIPVSKLQIDYDNVYMLIGSIISFYSLDNKIIYGSGLINPNDEVKGIPKEIISVRGPKTREALINKGYSCPERYGDPAILLPIFYTPRIKNDKRGCLIVNMGTETNDLKSVEALMSVLDIKIISLTNYNKWTDVIDEIFNSSFVISESLHGLIVAETYGIPNVWVEFKNHPEYWNFKFDDFFESIGKDEKIIQLQKSVDVELIKNKIERWQKAEINYEKMLSCFPFEIKN